MQKIPYSALRASPSLERPFFEKDVLFIVQNYYKAFCCFENSDYNADLCLPFF